jgi:hypothetical protein
MTETSSPTVKSAEDLGALSSEEAAPTDESPVRTRARVQLAAVIETLRASDEFALRTLADRLTAELDDLAYQSGHDHVDW